MLLDINEKGGEEVAAKIRASGGDAAFMRCNVTSQADCAAAAEAAFQRWGSIDSLVNCAGATRRRTVEDLEEKDWDLVLNVTLKSVYLMCHNVVPYMKKQGHGKIVNIGSAANDAETEILRTKHELKHFFERRFAERQRHPRVLRHRGVDDDIHVRHRAEKAKDVRKIAVFQVHGDLSRRNASAGCAAPAARTSR